MADNTQMTERLANVVSEIDEMSKKIKIAQIQEL